jgi:hypothetical protein
METPIYATSIKDRLPMLKQSLPTWLKQPHKAILILDWDSPDQGELLEFVREVQDGTVFAAKVGGRKLYEHSRCRNIKTALCRFLFEPFVQSFDCESEFVFSIDSDIIVKKNPMEEIESKWQSRDALYVFGGVENGWMPHSTGTSLHTVGRFLKAGGCDENMKGWGREDLKFFDSMARLGLKIQLSGGCIEHIDHSDKARTKYCDEKNKWASNAENGFLMDKPVAVYKRDFDIELISPDGSVRIISPDDDLYGGAIKEI